MFKLAISMAWNYDLEGLEDRVYKAVVAKFIALNDELYAKVVENVSGRLLHKQSGLLASQVYRSVEIGSESMHGEVGISPESPKAWALEKGGESSYIIVPTKASVLRFYWEKMGHMAFLKSVHHPPAKEYGYLRNALAEMVELVPEEMAHTIDEALRGRGR